MGKVIPSRSTLVFDVELLEVGGAGTGQKGTLWNSQVGGLLLLMLTALVLWGLRDTLTNHSFSDHFFAT